MAGTSNLAWKAGASLMAVGIGGGALGAHTFAKRIGERGAVWSLASHYATINGVALLVISQHPVYAKRAAPLLIASGTFLFTFSIYGLLLSQNKILRKICGPATPVGGVLMLAGVASLLI